MKLLISWHKFGRDLFDSALAALPLLFTNCVSRDDRKGRKSISSALRLWLPHTFSYRFSTGFIFEHQILMMKFYDETFRGRRKKTGRRWVNKHLAQSPHFLLWTSLDIIKIGYSLKYSIKRRREVGRQEFVVLILKRFAFSIIISHFTSSWFWFYFLFFCSLHSKDSPSSKLMFDPFYLDNICIKHNDTTTTTMMHIQEVKKEEKKLHPWGIFALSFSLSLSYCILYLLLCFNSRWKLFETTESLSKYDIISTHFSSGGGGISCIGVEIGVFSISIIANGASGSGSGDTALSPIAPPSAAAGSDAFPALLPNLTDFMKLFNDETLCSL